MPTPEKGIEHLGPCQCPKTTAAQNSQRGRIPGPQRLGPAVTRSLSRLFAPVEQVHQVHDGAARHFQDLLPAAGLGVFAHVVERVARGVEGSLLGHQLQLPLLRLAELHRDYDQDNVEEEEGADLERRERKWGR